MEPEDTLSGGVKVTPVYTNEDDDSWIMEVFWTDSEGAPTVRVYINDKTLRVEPSGLALRNEFGWSDWIFDNVQGDVRRAAIIAALAVIYTTSEY